MLKTLVSLFCNHTNCKTAPITAGARKATKIAARKAGWKIKGLNVMFCPAHRAENGFPTAAQRKAERLAKKAKATKKVTKSVTHKPVVNGMGKIVLVGKPVTKKAVKPVTGIGQRVPGMVAKSAKRATLKK